MSFIGDMLGTKNTYQAQGVDQSLLGTAYNQDQDSMDRQKQFVNALGAQNGLGNQQDVFGMQRNLAGQLQNIGNGTGPNPALAQLNQATGQNIAAQGALMAGQRGASANSGLLARLAAQQGGALQQQAVGQGATLQAQQQLSALAQLQQQQGQMAGLANQQVNQQQTGLNSLRSAGLQEQANLMGLQTNANTVNAGVANQNTATQGQIAGGLLMGAAGAAMPGGGKIPGKAQGGVIEPMQGGGQVPGQPEVGHNSYKNDTVPAMLSPGEQVIDLNTLHDSGPVGEAARFVAHHINKRNQAMACGGQVHNYADGGTATKEIPVKMPDPQKARDANKGLEEGQTLAKGWENAKSFFAHPMDNLSKANGGVIKGYENGGYVAPSYLRGFTKQEMMQHDPMQMTADYNNADPSGLRAAPEHSEGEQALGDIKNYWEGLKSFGSAAKDALFSPPGGDEAFYGARSPKMLNPPESPQAPSAQQPSAPQNQNYDLSKLLGTEDQSAKAPTVFDPYKGINVAAGYNKAIAGYQNQGAAEADVAKAQLPHMQQYKEDTDAILTTMQANQEEHAMDVDNTVKAMKDIDPQRYLRDMPGGQRISTAIGLILGGIGGGLTHQENPAMRLLMNAIDKDVDSQKTNLGKQNDILRAYESKYKDKQMALEMYRATRSQQLADQLKTEALKKGDALSASRADIATGPLMVERDKALREANMQRMMMGAMNSSNPEATMGVMRMMNPERAKEMESRFVPGAGFASIPVPQEARKEITLRKNFDDKMKQLESFSIKHQGTVMDRAVVNTGKTMAADAQNAARAAMDGGVWKPGEQSFINTLVAEDPTAFFANIRTLPKYKAMRSTNASSLGNLYKNYGLKAPQTTFNPR